MEVDDPVSKETNNVEEDVVATIAPVETSNGSAKNIVEISSKNSDDKSTAINHQSTIMSAKKNNLLGVIQKIKPQVTMSITSNNNFVTTFSPSISVSSNGKRKSSPPMFKITNVSKASISTELLARQTVASATVPTSGNITRLAFVRSASSEDAPNPSLIIKEKNPPQNTVGSETVPKTIITAPKSTSSTTTTAETSNLDAGDMFSDNVLSHMLDFLYKGMQSRGESNGFPQPQGCSDEPSLDMPRRTRKYGIEVLMECMQNGTPYLKDILLNGVDIILECKCCRGLFRSVDNLIKHKKLHCKATGAMSKILGRTGTIEEDKIMNSVLNILNPQDNRDEDVMDFEAIPTNSNAVYQTASKPKPNASYPTTSFRSFTPQSNAKSTPQYIILNQPKAQISRGSIKTIQPSSAIHSSINSNIIISGANKSHLNTVNVTSTPIVNGQITKPRFDKTPNRDFKNSIDFSMSPELKAAVTENKKKPKCPLCQKEMAERKNVKRHLVHVHMLSVQDTWKLMHRTMPLSTPSPAAKKKATSPFSTTARSCEEMSKICVEQLPIGDDRKINVLPKTYAFPDSYCPICSRPMSSRNNVRRHMLESHDFLLYGDKKYYQLKILLVKDACIMDGSNRSMRRFYTSSSRMDVDQIKAELESLEALKAQQDKNQKKSPDKKSPEKKSPASVNNVEVSQNMSPGISKVEAKTMIDATNCKCLACDQEFLRRQTLKNHMLQEHSWSKDLFNIIYDEAYVKKSDESDQESADSDEKENDEAGPVKISNFAQETDAVIEPLNEANRKVVKTVLLHKIVSTSSNPKTLGSLNKVLTTNATTKLRDVANNSATISSVSPGVYMLKTSTKITQISATNPTQNTKGEKRKLDDDDEVIEGVPVKKEKLFDIGQNLCRLCDQEFGNTSLLKRHMIEVHSCTMEQVLGASRDSKSVSPEVQKYGESKGYDIENAKCLICSKYFFMRHALKKHLNKVHSFSYEMLQGLHSEDENSESDENSKTEDKKSSGFQLRNIVKREASVEENQDDEGTNSSQVSLLLNISFDKFMITPNCLERTLSVTAAAEALEILPTSAISPTLMKCLKCNHKYTVLWDLKVHILKHIGLGIYACKFCNENEIKCAYRLDLIMDHITNDHPTVSRRAATTAMKSAKINNREIWKAYGLPLRK